jgi:hypothetical protein
LVQISARRQAVLTEVFRGLKHTTDTAGLEFNLEMWQICVWRVSFSSRRYLDQVQRLTSHGIRLCVYFSLPLCIWDSSILILHTDRMA